MRPARIRARGRRAGLVAAVEARTSSCRSSTTGAPDGRCVGSRSSTPSPSRSVTAGRALKPTDRTPETPFALQARPGQATHRAGAAAPRQGAVGPDTGRAAGPTTWRWRRESIWTARCACGPSRLCGAPDSRGVPAWFGPRTGRLVRVFARSSRARRRGPDDRGRDRGEPGREQWTWRSGRREGQGQGKQQQGSRQQRQEQEQGATAGARATARAKARADQRSSAFWC